MSDDNALLLTQDMTPEQLAQKLESLVFTASYGWERRVKMDVGVRNYLVRVLRHRKVPK